MIHVDFEKNIMKRGTDIVIVDENKGLAYTLQIESHQVTEHQELPCTTIGKNDEFILDALADLVQKMGLVKDRATDAELRATEKHLQDMRKLVFKD